MTGDGRRNARVRTNAEQLRLGAGLAISAIFALVFLSSAPLRQVADIVGNADGGWVTIALCTIGLAYLLKIRRLQMMLAALGSKASLATAAVPLMGAVALNNMLPFRAGDVMRVIAFRRLTGISPTSQLSTLALERLLDLLALLVILFAAVTVWPTDALPASFLNILRTVAAAVAAAILSIIVMPGTVRRFAQSLERRRPALRPISQAIVELAGAIAELARPQMLVRLFGLSLLAWLAESGAFLAIAYALGLTSSLQAALLTLSVGTLSTIIPSSPGYVGTFHYFTALVLTAGFGVGQAAAAAFAILIHFLLWGSTTAAGLILLTRAGLAASPNPGRLPSQISNEPLP